MKARIVIELEGREYGLREYLEWWRENESGDNAYTQGPKESCDNLDVKALDINCTYWMEETGEVDPF